MRHVGSSSLTRDRTRAPCMGKHRVLTAGPPGKLPGTHHSEPRSPCCADGPQLPGRSWTAPCRGPLTGVLQLVPGWACCWSKHLLPPTQTGSSRGRREPRARPMGPFADGMSAESAQTLQLSPSTPSFGWASRDPTQPPPRLLFHVCPFRLARDETGSAGQRWLPHACLC